MWRLMLRVPMSAWLAALVVACLAAGCDAGGLARSGPTGTLVLGLDGVASGVDDVSGVDYAVACADGTQVTAWVPLEGEGLPAHVDAERSGAAFADLFRVLPAGACTVTATPMQDPTLPSEDCAPASAEVAVAVGVTTEVVLTILCGAPTGGADVVTTLDHAPAITGWVVAPDTTAPACTEVALRAEAEDVDGDPLTFSFDVTPPSPDATFELTREGDVARLLAETPGTYSVSAAVSDGLVEATASIDVTVEDGPIGCLSTAP